MQPSGLVKNNLFLHPLFRVYIGDNQFLLINLDNSTEFANFNKTWTVNGHQ